MDFRHGLGLTAAGDRFRLGARRVPLAMFLRAMPPDVERVVLAGPRMFDTLDDLRDWSMRGLPDGWLPGSHWLPDIDGPILRYRREVGDPLEILSGRAWFGAGAETVSVDGLRDAWAMLADVVGRRFGVTLMPAPATTGREMFRANIPFGVGFPILPWSVAELIRSTSGQGRMEVLTRHDVELPAVVELDGRFMYGALSRTVPVGVPTMILGEPADPYLPARHRARWTPPAGWSGVGVLPVAADRGWRYPSTPGEPCSGWIDGAELLVARRAGWSVDVFESMVWPRYTGPQPLRPWVERIAAERRNLESDPSTAASLVRAALRVLCITAIGAFVGNPFAVERWVPVDRADLVPTTSRNARQEGRAIVFEVGRRNTWRDGMAHPEWAASIWARARARMLDGPAGPGARSGALHLPPGIELLAVALDALYLTADPRWPDDGTDGRLRVKHVYRGPFPPAPGRRGFYTLMRELRSNPNPQSEDAK